MRIVHRRGTAANWAAANPILRSTEIGYDTSSYPYRYKIGDGATPWLGLPFASQGVGTGADPLSFYQTYGYVQIAGAFGSDGNPDVATQTRINTLVALGIPQTAILIAVMSAISVGVLTADNATSTSTSSTAELATPGFIGADNATSISTAGQAELTPQGAIGADNATSASIADVATLVGVLPADNAASASTADNAELSGANVLPSATIVFVVETLPSATISFSNIH